MRLPAALLLAALLGTACASSQALAPDLVAAAQQGRLPAVVACWEKELERAELSGSYVATVDFTVEGGTSKIRDAHVEKLEPESGGGEGPATLRQCIERGLEKSALPTAAGPEGPAFKTAADVRVVGYRFAFADETREKRRRAERRQANVLLGPRADRCQGLYSHDPPRDASTLYAEIAQAERAAASAADRDALARALQKAYDAELELRARLAWETADPMLPEANRARSEAALKEVEVSAARAGRKIGCVASPR